MTYRYDVYGLLVDSDVDLHLDRAADDTARSADLVVRRAPGSSGQAPLAGRTVLEHVRDGRCWYRAVELGGGQLVLRFDGVLDVELAPDGRRAVWRPAPGGDEGVAAVLLAGAFLAFVLTWRGDLVLHGSAVDLVRDDRAAGIGFVGRSGMGKSTMATLLCRAGGSLVTDDVLVLDRHGAGVVPRRGAAEVRLRDGAVALADELGAAGAPLRTSGDARHALHLAGTPGAAAMRPPAPLAALVIPFPDRSHDELRVQRLTPREAAITLMRVPRLSEWQDHAVTARHFADLVALTAQVPVLLARVPWGPPFRHDVVEDLIRTVLTGDLPGAEQLVQAGAQAVGSE
ncbi:hypothetical protein M1843_13940 [Isoptericola sp. 4D.3]|jgi:hypothetical protein|uniref:HPr kinase n=1 Tax=Isoptericola peretonis TaxID=2918523 RepID=A0ABT0J5S2_9MICO|nr:hypothetical protein [Isoptericola sp. 4D.3]